MKRMLQRENIFGRPIRCLCPPRAEAVSNQGLSRDFRNPHHSPNFLLFLLDLLCLLGAPGQVPQALPKRKYGRRARQGAHRVGGWGWGGGGGGGGGWGRSTGGRRELKRGGQGKRGVEAFFHDSRLETETHSPRTFPSRPQLNNGLATPETPHRKTPDNGSITRTHVHCADPRSNHVCPRGSRRRRVWRRDPSVSERVDR